MNGGESVVQLRTAVLAVYELKVTGSALSISGSPRRYMLREILVVAMPVDYYTFVAIICAQVRNSCITRPKCIDRLVH